MSDNIYPSGQIEKAKEGARGRSRYWQQLSLLTIAGLLCGYVVRYFNWSEDISEAIDRLVVSLGFFILLIGLVFRELSRIRKEKYANIQEDLHGIQHVIRDQLTTLEIIDAATDAEKALRSHIVRQNVQECLNRFSAIFTLLTGTKCRASIKMIEPGASEDQPVVYTYMRDLDSERFDQDEDYERRMAGEDLLSDNTDFTKVFGERGDRWFFCNDLTSQSNYLNSRDSTLGRRDLSGMKGLLNLLRPVDWQLPYSSNIVWPIRQKKIGADLQSEFSFIGFLTIDSKHRNVFDDKFDTHLGAGVADSLFYMLARLNDVGTEGNSNEDQPEQ